jgi:hypothetical protein
LRERNGLCAFRPLHDQCALSFRRIGQRAGEKPA